VWEAATGNEVARMTHDDWVVSAAFSPNGKYIVSGSWDNTVRLWAWNPEVLIKNACENLPRNLTYAEWAQYIGDILPYQAVCPNLALDLKPAAKDTLSRAGNPDRVKNALDEVKANLLNDNTVKDPDAESLEIVGAAVKEQVSTEVTNRKIKNALDLLEQAKKHGMQLSLDNVSTLNIMCWSGSLQGYVKQVLQYCELAVNLAPNDADVRDSRGLARALTGDVEGAILDFQYLVDHFDQPATVEERKQWIVKLKNGTNPFTPEVLESLR
jgi:hypothetical protein